MKGLGPGHLLSSSVPVVSWWLLALVFALIWAGSALLLDTWARRERRPDLAERTAPFQRPWVADEAERWLAHQDLG